VDARADDAADGHCLPTGRVGLGAVAIVQLVLAAVAGGSNERLRSFGRSLGRYLAQVTGFLTFATEEVPFPFVDWPAGE
jgi:hypothetical protein